MAVSKEQVYLMAAAIAAAKASIGMEPNTNAIESASLAYEVALQVDNLFAGLETPPE